MAAGALGLCLCAVEDGRGVEADEAVGRDAEAGYEVYKVRLSSEAQTSQI